ncbi:hypothetical protein MTO96_019847 [Rhipicephalus appendiculatus]
MSPIHKCDPATAERGSFCLLRFRPRPVRSSLDDLATPGSPWGRLVDVQLSADTGSTRVDTGKDSPASSRPLAQASRQLDYRGTPRPPAIADVHKLGFSHNKA